MKFLYINTRNIYPHDRHIIDGLRENGHEVLEIEENAPGQKKYSNLAKRLKDQRGPYDAAFVGFTCPLFVPIARKYLHQPIIFNATSSQYEGNVVSRDIAAFSFQAIKWWLIDLVSFLFASKVLLESRSQIAYVRKGWNIKASKLVRSWSGLNEKEFYYDSSIAKNPQFTVLFRGRFLPESGVDTVIKAAKILEDSGVRFLVVGHGFMHRNVDELMSSLRPTNLELIDKLPIDELRRRMQACHLSLGQMADHRRLLRTLPCKSFESLAMRLPYLTARNPAILELLTEDETCFCSAPGDAQDLSDKILELRDDPASIERVAQNGYRLYKDNLTSKHLAADIVSTCFPKP